MASSDETLDKEQAVELLNEALRLQYRSVLQFTLTSGSLFGFEVQAIGDRLWAYAQDEIADTRLLIEKVVALGGSPTTDVGELRWSGGAGDAVSWLIEAEEEAIDALQEAIEPTGREGRSEALEHMLEHMIMRKQNQVDFLLRSRRTS